jgi:hypothetical protein
MEARCFRSAAWWLRALPEYAGFFNADPAGFVSAVSVFFI